MSRRWRQIWGLILVGASVVACEATAPSSPVVEVAPAGPTCGDGRVEGSEACDGDARACADLGGTWSDGGAGCRSDCRGFEIAACVRADATKFELVKPAERDPERFASARCNDGTAFPISVRLSPSGSHEWVIYLEGGVYCDDHSYPCSERPPPLKSTQSDPDRTLVEPRHTGVFNGDPAANPTFASANHVWAHYCSSDFWTGATTERRPSSGDAARGWYFSGHANVDAMLAMLQQRYGLDDREPDLKVLFGGGSAGAFGAHLNAARVATALPAAARARRILLLVDAGWMTAWDEPGFRLGGAEVSDREVWRRARAFWGGTFDPACDAATSEPADCMFGPTWYPLVVERFPTLVQQSYTDGSFTAVHGIQAGSPALERWAAQTEESLASVEHLFATTEPYHVIGISDELLGSGPPGATFREVLHRFWKGGAPERVFFPRKGPAEVPTLQLVASDALCFEAALTTVKAADPTLCEAKGP